MKWYKIVTVYFLMLWGASLWGKSVYVGTVKGISVPESDVNAVEELIRSSVAGELKHKLVNSSADADYVVSGKLVKLGEAYSVTLVKNKGESEVFRATLKSSLMSDMDVVVGRLVRAIDSETEVEKNASVKDVTYDEEKNQRRKKDVISQLAFGVGPATASSLNVDGRATLWNVGYNYEIDFNWDMHVDMDWLTTHKSSENDAYFLGLNFGITHYLLDSQASPFLEGHIGYGMTTASTGCSSSSLFCSSKDRASGWLGGLGIGMRFFRTSKSNFAVVLRGSIVGEKTSQTQQTPSVGSLMIIGYFH